MSLSLLVCDEPNVLLCGCHSVTATETESAMISAAGRKASKSDSGQKKPKLYKTTHKHLKCLSYEIGLYARTNFTSTTYSADYCCSETALCLCKW